MDLNKDTLAETCFECGLTWDKHRLDVFREHWAATHPPLHEPNMDTSNYPAVPLAMNNMADFIVVGSGSLAMPGAAVAAGLPSHLPALHFRFLQGAHVIAEVNYIGRDEEMRGLRTIVGQQIDLALRSARKRR